MKLAPVFSFLSFLSLIPGGDELPGRERIEQAVAEVLARREYLPPVKSWWERAKEWFGEQFRELVGGLFRALDMETPLGWAIIIFLAVSLLALLVHIVWTLVAAAPSRSSRRASMTAAASRLPTPQAMADGLAEARRLAGEGKFALAMHSLYRATLFWIDQQGAARFEPSKTAGDYARELESGDARRSFRGMIEAFDPVAWGARPAREEQWQRMRTAASSLGVPA